MRAAELQLWQVQRGIAPASRALCTAGEQLAGCCCGRHSNLGSRWIGRWIGGQSSTGALGLPVIVWQVPGKCIGSTSRGSGCGERHAAGVLGACRGLGKYLAGASQVPVMCRQASGTAGLNQAASQQHWRKHGLVQQQGIPEQQLILLMWCCTQPLLTV
jgi:hypothetical protein